MHSENRPNLKLTETTDPRLDALLDAALGPEAVPTDLNERIVAATARDLPVAARWNAPMGLLRLAAVLAMAVGLGVVMWSASQSSESSLPPIASDNATAPAPATLDDLETRLARLTAVSESITDNQSWIDDQIDMVSLQVELVQTAADWPDEDEAIEVTGTRYELDQLVDEMSLMF